MLNVIINGKLTQAINAGVRIELVRTHAPKKLPLSDMEFCLLVMNLMDNAVAGVLESHAQEPYIKLDMHTKNGFFVFYLENSARKQKKKPVPEHGLGLKIRVFPLIWASAFRREEKYGFLTERGSIIPHESSADSTLQQRYSDHCQGYPNP